MWKRIYLFIDSIWQWIAEKVFVRFDFQLPVDQLRKLAEEGKLTFALTQGGFLDWLILSSWCRSQGFPAILIANRLRILLFAKPKFFFQILFGLRTYAELYISQEKGPRLLFCPTGERKKPFQPTKVEKLLSEIYLSLKPQDVQKFWIVPVFILWRKHMRGPLRQPSEYLFGLSSNPNLLGKIWYLIRKRFDSTVKNLTIMNFPQPEALEEDDAFDDSESLRVVKALRRKILVLNNQEMRVVVGPRYLSPDTVKESLLRDPEIQQLMRNLAENEGKDRKKLMSEAYQDLTEIVSNYRYRFIEVMYVVLTWLYTRIFDGLESDDGELQKVREVIKQKPIVFVPCHRSHFDYLIMPYIFFLNDIVSPHVAAGVNLAFWPVGYFLRMGGAFFIRRSFRGDILYSTLLKKYIHYLLTNRINIKFFIEGTRSRSGKMLPPAYGILKMILEAQQLNVVDDIALIPVSICYDEVPEQSSYSKELGGAEKKKENAKQLIRSRSIISRKMGKVYLKFSDPIYTKDLSSRATQNMTLTLQKTAFELCRRINQVTPVTAKSLVTTVFLGHPKGEVSLGELLYFSEFLWSWVRQNNGITSVTSEDVLKRAVERIVKNLQKSGEIKVSDAVPRAYYCDPKKRILLNFYKNSAIHVFILPSISMIALYLTYQQKGVTSTQEFLDAVKTNLLKLRNYLKFEFFFSPTNEFIGEWEHCMATASGQKDWKSLLVTDLFLELEKNIPNPDTIGIFMRTVADLFESYLLMFETVGALGRSEKVEKKGFIQKVLKIGEERLNQQKLFFPESVSLQNLSNALLLLENLKLVSLIRDKDKTYVQFIGSNEALSDLREDFQSYFGVSKEEPGKFAVPNGRWKT